MEINTEGCPVGEFASADRMLSLSAQALNADLFFILDIGINLVEANDFSKWLFTIEVMGDSVYVVKQTDLISRFAFWLNSFNMKGGKAHPDVQIRFSIPNISTSCSICCDRWEAGPHASCTYFR